MELCVCSAWLYDVYSFGETYCKHVYENILEFSFPILKQSWPNQVLSVNCDLNMDTPVSNFAAYWNSRFLGWFTFHEIVKLFKIFTSFLLSGVAMNDWLKYLRKQNDKSISFALRFPPEIRLISPAQIPQIVRHWCQTLGQPYSVHHRTLDIYEQFMMAHFTDLYRSTISSHDKRSKWQTIYANVKHQALLRLVSCFQIASKLEMNHKARTFCMIFTTIVFITLLWFADGQLWTSSSIVKEGPSAVWPQHYFRFRNHSVDHAGISGKHFNLRNVSHSFKCVHFRSIFLLLLNTSRQSCAIWFSPIKKGQKIACLFRSLTLYTTYRNCFWILFITTVAVSFVTSSPLFVVRFTSGRKHGNQSFFFLSFGQLCLNIQQQGTCP